MKRIIYTRPDGGMSVVTPVRDKDYPEVMTDDQVLARAMRDVPVVAVNVQVVDVDALPVDRTYRNAWTQAGGVVVHDMVKAREIQKDILRKLRQPLLDALDIEFMQALEKGKSTVAIVAEKQALRDVTTDPALTSANTVEALKLVIPAVLT